MTLKINKLLIIFIFLVAACQTDPETNRTYIGISGPAKVLHADQLAALLAINGVEGVDDNKLISGNVISIEFTPRTNECRKQWIGKPYCEVDKRALKQTDTYQQILMEMRKFCGENAEPEIRRNGVVAGKYRAIFRC